MRRALTSLITNCLENAWLRKLTLLTTVALLSLLIAFNFALPQADNQLVPESKNQTKELAYKIRGTWTYHQDDTYLEIQVHPEWVQEEKIIAYVSDYCQPAIAEFLAFEVDGDCLRFAHALWRGYAFDLPRLHQMEMQYKIIKGDTLLLYEAVEAECQNYQQVELKRSSNTVEESIFQTPINL